MIEHVLMDYDGEAVEIEDGQKWFVSPEEGQHWNASTRQFEDDEPDEEEEDEVDYPRHKYHDWYDCNTDWRSW